MNFFFEGPGAAQNIGQFGLLFILLFLHFPSSSLMQQLCVTPDQGQAPATQFPRFKCHHFQQLHGKQPRIAIVGAGITGTTLAIALTRRNIPFTVYEQSLRATEVGAGLGIGPNAVRAMKIIDEKLFESFLRVRTPRDIRSLASKGCEVQEWKGKEEAPVWIEFLDGTSPVDARKLEPAFKVFAKAGDHLGAVQRAKWLEVLMGMVPGGVVQFGKRLEGIEQDGERVILKFEDGTMAEADAVVGCDGVKSKVREVLVGGREMYGAKSGYSGKYAYRCMIPMESALEVLGRERTGVSSLWMGHGRHVLTFPLGNPGTGQLLNLVAFVTDSNQSWPKQDSRSFTLPATREDVLRDFDEGGFSRTIQNLLRLTKDKMDKWGLFDLAVQPLPTFCSSRILIIGDAAHASTPHHGSGAGFCMEDVAVLSSLLEELVWSHDEPNHWDFESVFAALDASRRERDQWLVQSSRRAADLYEWRLPNTGKEHFEAMRKDIEERQVVCWGIDLDKTIREAKDDLRRRRGVLTQAAAR
ncbi:FAD/NAD(P)-binding domain-containing protein [Parathielavia appendiculata]|uniref:FAD/NAD(P)-binding domain-containing protein n=1 Tax=Parathielavia appendiculata TaxID=2587402 RepID=A0AAN6TPL6_9PEZI|nr:FAD/NAD(P)-binding domain-containing protein [Parathielavia appendiculata]